MNEPASQRRALAWGRRCGIPKGSNTSWKQLEVAQEMQVGTAMVVPMTISLLPYRGVEIAFPVSLRNSVHPMVALCFLPNVCIQPSLFRRLRE